jgi:hypothetical protein
VGGWAAAALAVSGALGWPATACEDDFSDPVDTADSGAGGRGEHAVARARVRSDETASDAADAADEVIQIDTTYSGGGGTCA